MDVRKIDDSSIAFQSELYFIENSEQTINIWDGKAESSKELASYKALGALEQLSKSDVQWMKNQST